MPNAATARPLSRRARSLRADGAETRSHILEVAGRIFAAKGYNGTTSREICTAAGTNLAAVNYHFGSRDALYDAVLVEAHGQLVALGDLEAIAASGRSARAKLRAVIALFVGRAAATALPWGLRVLVHELAVAPSKHVEVLMRQAVLPKIRLMLAMVAEVLGRAEDDPMVQRALAFVVMPCIMMVIAPRARLRKVLPALSSDPQALVDDMSRFALGGLAALAQRSRGGDT
jgi:AcrR family transcriptional regulator